MRDDEKMYSIGWTMLIGIGFIISFLQVAYRVQNSNLNDVRREMDNTRHEYDIAKTKFSALTSADSLRGSVVGVKPKAETVSFSKTVHIDDIPMVGK